MRQHCGTVIKLSSFAKDYQLDFRLRRMLVSFDSNGYMEGDQLLKILFTSATIGHIGSLCLYYCMGTSRWVYMNRGQINYDEGQSLVDWSTFT